MNDTTITIDPRQWQDPARVAELRRLAALGLVVREIAAAMGTTHGAVRHACARYKVREVRPRHQTYAPNAGTMTTVLNRLARREAKERKNKKASGTAEGTVPALRGDGQRDTPTDSACRTEFSALGPGDCRWPGPGKPTLFCASPAIPGISYCPRHAALAYRGYGKGPQP